MKKYKVLLAGRNNTIIDDFFNHMRDDFIMVTTSIRYEDVVHHLNFFEPDIFVYCLKDESREDLLGVMEHKRRITRDGVTTVIIGSQEDCDNFRRIAVYMEDLVLVKPISVNTIREKILKYMEEIEVENEGQKQLVEKLATIKMTEERKHVLVIDDDPLMLKLIKEHLHEQYDVATAISGKIAYKFLESKKTDLILLDYEMPLENGPAVMKKIREKEALADIPIIFLTGITEKEKIREALVLKPQGYLLKPIDKEKLLGTIEKYI